ncbi:hypothetical protein [Chitinophaga sp. CF418]|uniref:hypothetical protein n=1 Tax=Chitinophaga sp. CF418 TaxID=1855287 RepID=UPI000920DAF8|nr:hypothetical protein [Chitinophaga sp. CF418]SHN17273.1 hypothetical protein SAMN05216311_106131 [Chitinophaga sp. CF418]
MEFTIKADVAQQILVVFNIISAKFIDPPCKNEPPIGRTDASPKETEMAEKKTNADLTDDTAKEVNPVMKFQGDHL